MTNAAPDTLAAALALPDHDRAFLASELLNSLPAPLTEMDEKEYAAELQCRIDAHDQDPSISDDWEHVSRRLLDALEKHRKS